jgi:hypothetical protein
MKRLRASRVKSLLVSLAFSLAVTAFASPQAQQAPPAPPEKAKPESKKTKKVWTDDDLQNLHGKSGVSVVGNALGVDDADKAEAKQASYVQEKDPNWYHKQLMPLRAEIERLDKEITKTREFMNGGHTGEGQLKVNVFSVPMNPTNHIAQLEKRKATVQSKIDALEDQARRNDIPPGALR